MTECRVLYITEDPELIRQQLEGYNIKPPQLNALRDNISTDHIIPTKYGYQNADPERLGLHLLRGLGEDLVKEGEVKQGNFKILIAGRSFGRGSSREHAQLAILGAGITYIAARTIERIFWENCINHGLPLLDWNNPDIRKQVINGRTPNPETYLKNLPSLSRMVMERGGLLNFTKDRLEGRVYYSNQSAKPHPMTAVEKIIAAHAGVKYVEPGQQFLVRVDGGYGYELQTTVIDTAINKAGLKLSIPHPEKFDFFEDHLAFKQDGYTFNLRSQQRAFAAKLGCKVYRSDLPNGVEGICHTVMADKTLPGQLIVGNDSHTCSLGVNSLLPLGIGASQMAAALYTEDIVMTVPESIKFELYGSLKPGVMSKDLMLYILGLPEFRRNLIGSNRAWIFSGTGLDGMSYDEQFTITNMTSEGQAALGLIMPNHTNLHYLSKLHGIDIGNLNLYTSDPEAQYYKVIPINLDSIEPMISLPGDTQNTISITSLRDRVYVNIAYLGSCTGGKLEDLVRAGNILKGKKVNPNVQFYIQASSQKVYQEAFRLGLIKTFEESNAIFLKPGCGACMGMGPGSTQKDEVGIFDTNRNFYGRTGFGQTYLANPEVVAASAISGFITKPN